MMALNVSLVVNCFKNCFATPQHFAPEVNPVTLDPNHMGHEVVLVKNNLRICGTGGALGSAPLVQSKSYFEVKIQQSGIWGLGLATYNTNLNNAPGGIDPESWVLTHEGCLKHNNLELRKTEHTLQEGDIVGVTFDHIELNFYVNGKNMECPISNIKGSVYPALFVGEGAILDLIVDSFTHPPPSGFDRIMIEQSLL